VLAQYSAMCDNHTSIVVKKVVRVDMSHSFWVQFVDHGFLTMGGSTFESVPGSFRKPWGVLRPFEIHFPVPNLFLEELTWPPTLHRTSSSHNLT
jgi:hypothetical protein